MCGGVGRLAGRTGSSVKLRKMDVKFVENIAMRKKRGIEEKRPQERALGYHIGHEGVSTPWKKRSEKGDNDGGSSTIIYRSNYITSYN